MGDINSAPGTRRKNPWNLLLLPFALAAGAGMVWPVNRALLWLQAMQCPPEAYLASPTNGGAILTVVPLIFVAIGPALMIGNAIGRSLPGVSQLIDDNARGHSGPGFSGAQRALRRFSVWIFLLLFPISLIGAFSHYCISPDNIFLRQYPWSARSYAWDEVRKVDADCFHSGRTFRYSYELVMQDGAAVDLAVSTNKFIDAFPAIENALRGRSFTFTSNSAACPPHLKAIFEKRVGF